MNGKVAELKNRLNLALHLRGKKAIDLSKDLGIPKSAVSQYLSGKSQKMDSARLYSICNYLNVSEPWLLGYDVAMERTMEKKNDTIVGIVNRLRKDDDFLFLVESLHLLDADKLNAIKQMLIVLK